MIDIEKAKKEFTKYTNQFDISNPGISRKIGHSLRVMKISNQIAQSLELEEEKIRLATLIGLLHDIARFEQMKQYNTFRDCDSIDHGDYGVEILNKDIRKYIDTNKYDTIIKTAIKNHNKFSIEEGLTEEELLFAKIIRDADKTDIFYESVDMFWKDEENEIENDNISDNILNQFRNNSLIKRRTGAHKKIDSVITILAFIFDINFKPTFAILKKEDYINKIINRFDFKNQETKEKMEEIRKIANEYIEEKIKG